VASLAPHRHPLLQQELELLDRTVEHLYRLPEDLARARVPDGQGLGGSLAPRVTGRAP
jgi:hypothetical protein